MNKKNYARSLFLILALMLLAGCGGSSDSNGTAPLSADNVNLIFVVSPDLAYHGIGDIHQDTANLSNQGLQRSLLMATYLKEEVLGAHNVTAIYTLEPMTHLQTADKYPDMAAILYIQQFALLNQITLDAYTANSYTLSASYSGGGQGLDFNNTADNNVLATRIIEANEAGFYVFSAPWETITALLASINETGGYNLTLPTTYRGPNDVYAISILRSSGEADLLTYNGNLDPPSTYPVLPAPLEPASCGVQPSFNITRTGGVDGAVIPQGINTNQTVYMIRHAEAHPTLDFEDGNIVGAGQWRALGLPSALSGKISPDMVYSIDPSLPIPDDVNFSYVRPSLTVAPYAIANNLPYYLAWIPDFYELTSFETTSKFFFTGGKFSNQTILLGWEHDHFAPTINALLATYGASGGLTVDPAIWQHDDYDTIWTVTLDGQGNVTVKNELCEGIDSARLPATAPQF